MLKLLSLFSGIGAFEKALDYLDVKYQLVNYCEIDKYASKSYSLIHHVPESMNLGDITKVDTSKLSNDIDLISYGFPCQDISLAGKQRGFFQENIKAALKHLEFTDEEIQNLYTYIVKEKPSDSQLFDKLYDDFLLYEEDINSLLLMGINKVTRSGLFFEALRIIEATKPKIAIAENVKNLVSKKFKTEFGIVLKSLEEAGYNNYWQVLNAKNYGVPQNRERVFIVSIRKDIDNGSFKFPEPYELKLRLKDMLEDEVDEKYFLSDAMIKYISFTGTKGFKNPDCKINLDVARPLTTDPNKRAGTSNYVSKDLPDNFDLRDTDNAIRIGDYRYDEGFRERKDGICPTLPSSHLGTSSISGQPLIIQDTAKIIRVGKIDIKAKEQCKIVYDPEGISPTLDTMQGGNRQPKIIVVGNVNPSGKGMNGTVVDPEGLARTITLEKGEGQKILIRNATKKGYLEAEEGDGVDISGRMQYHRGTVQKGMSQTLTTDGGNSVGVVVAAAMRGRGEDNHQQIEVSDREYANAITTVQKDSMVAEISLTSCQQNEVAETPVIVDDMYKNREPRVYNEIAPTLRSERSGLKVVDGLRIRKLTPKECFRLMGFEDEVIDSLVGVSNTQLYKQAGNSIVVDVLEEIFVQLFKSAKLIS